MNVAFLFPGSDKYEALDNWVLTIARYAKPFDVRLVRHSSDCAHDDVVFVLTEGKTYPTAIVDQDIAALRTFAVVHNNDNPGVPTPGNYPSFCWTEQAAKRLAAYKPMLVRQPVLPPIMEPHSRPLHIGTFGHIERKKATYDMAKWAQNRGIPFTAFCPDVHTDLYSIYIDSVKRVGGNVVTYSWAERIEDLAPLFDDVSHFLFVLPRSKGASGGSPTSPRFATAFARPVIVVDDERGLEQDGIYVFETLDEIMGLPLMGMPFSTWGPEQYISELVQQTLAWRPA